MLVLNLNVNKEFLEQEGKILMEDFVDTDFSLYSDCSVYFSFIKLLIKYARKFEDFPQKIETIK